MGRIVGMAAGLCLLAGAAGAEEFATEPASYSCIPVFPPSCVMSPATYASEDTVRACEDQLMGVFADEVTAYRDCLSDWEDEQRDKVREEVRRLRDAIEERAEAALERVDEEARKLDREIADKERDALDTLWCRAENGGMGAAC